MRAIRRKHRPRGDVSESSRWRVPISKCLNAVVKSPPAVVPRLHYSAFFN